MESHVKLLATLYIVVGVLGLFAALVIILVFGGTAGIVSVTAPWHDDPDAWRAIPILGIVGTLLFVFVTILSIPGIIAGVGLLKFRPWSRILTIILSALLLVHFPFGTALGVYGLWVLFQKESEALFKT